MNLYIYVSIKWNIEAWVWRLEKGGELGVECKDKGWEARRRSSTTRAQAARARVLHDFRVVSCRKEARRSPREVASEHRVDPDQFRQGQ